MTYGIFKIQMDQKNWKEIDVTGKNNKKTPRNERENPLTSTLLCTDSIVWNFAQALLKNKWLIMIISKQMKIHQSISIQSFLRMGQAGSVEISICITAYGGTVCSKYLISVVSGRG